MNGDSIKVVITKTAILMYLSHNNVRVAVFKSIGAAQNCIKRRKYVIAETIWE